MASNRARLAPNLTPEDKASLAKWDEIDRRQAEAEAKDLVEPVSDHLWAKMQSAAGYANPEDDPLEQVLG